MTSAEMRARNTLKTMTTANLIDTFIKTGESKDANIYIVRGWLMDELEARNPEAFDEWLESDFNNDEDITRFYN